MLNGHSILLMIEKNRQRNCKVLPWLYSSQPCEETFRYIKSMTTTQSTIVNYSLRDILRRLNRIQVLNEISTDLDKLGKL